MGLYGRSPGDCVARRALAPRGPSHAASPKKPTLESPLGERSIVPDLVRLLADEKLDFLARGSIALALGTLGERSIAPELVRLFADEKLDFDVRGRIADALGTLGERSIVPDLVRQLADEKLHSYVRGRIADVLPVVC